MNAELESKDTHRYGSVVTVILAVQVTLLVFTFLDVPVYIEAYRNDGMLVVTGWLGGWLPLQLFGLGVALWLLFGSALRKSIAAPLRVKLAAGSVMGVIAGLLSLGLRFFPVISRNYFVMVGMLALILAAGYAFWQRNAHRQEVNDELFP